MSSSCPFTVRHCPESSRQSTSLRIRAGAPGEGCGCGIGTRDCDVESSRGWVLGAVAGRAAVEKGGGVARPSGDDEEASSKSVRYHKDRF